MEVYSFNNKMLSVNGKCISPKASGETWVLNQAAHLVNLDNEIIFPDTVINFMSNGVLYTKIYVASVKIVAHLYYQNDTIDNNVYWQEGGGAWVNDAYRTITFLEAPTGDLLTWLQNNGVKQ